MTSKIADIAVKTGEYQKDGETKGRWLNVGALMRNDDGGSFIILERTFNPAGLANPDNRNSVVLSVFTKDGQQQSAPQQGSAQGNDFDDECPF